MFGRTTLGEAGCGSESGSLGRVQRRIYLRSTEGERACHLSLRDITSHPLPVADQPLPLPVPPDRTLQTRALPSHREVISPARRANPLITNTLPDPPPRQKRGARARSHSQNRPSQAVFVREKNARARPSPSSRGTAAGRCIRDLPGSPGDNPGTLAVCPTWYR